MQWEEATPHQLPTTQFAEDELPTDSQYLIGKKVSHYRVLEVLGGGGMGVVYKAEDLKLGRRVALKFLPEELASDQAALKRFESEARAASALNHPNICTIYEVEEHEGQPFLVMELLEGQTLRDLIATKATAKISLELKELIKLAVQITAGLEAAHQQGIIHRDIKPANIFVTSQGQAKILDFGLAKLFLTETTTAESPAMDGSDAESQRIRNLDTESFTASSPFLSRTGVAMGTAGYMSPEQIRGEKLDARTDLFSFGLVLYEMATGQRPFTGDTAAALHNSIQNDTHAPAHELNPKLPAMLEVIINRALEKDREVRYQTASEIRADLDKLKRDKRLRHALGDPAEAPQYIEALPRRGNRFIGDTTPRPVPPLPPGLQIAPLTPWWRSNLALGMGGLVLVCTILAASYYRWPTNGPNLQDMQITRLTDSGRVGAMAISPDGRFVVYSQKDGGKQSLWVSRVTTHSNVMIVPAESCRHCWSDILTGRR